MDTLNVAQFLTAYNASLANVLDLKTSTITGTLKHGSDQPYGGGDLYWELVDGSARLTVRMPARYRHLQERRVAVTGQPTRRPREGRGDIRIVLNVEHMTPLDPTPDDWMGPLRLIGQQRQSSWPGIERSIESLIHAGDRPRVLMFHGTSSSMDKDVEAGLRPYADAYAIETRRIPLTDPTAVAAALSAGNIDANLVTIVRGGGEMPALSDRQVIEAVAYHMPVPIVSAVGHDVDQPLIQDVVHWAFAAPTALGTWLADRAKGAIHAREAMALDHTHALEAMQRQLTELSEVATAAKLSETAAREAAAQLAETTAREATVAMQRQLTELSEAVTAAKLAETAARDAAAQAREEAMVLRLDLQKSESRRRTMQYMSAVLLVVLVILVFMLVL